MSKDSFFAKFAHFYIANLKCIKDHIVFMWDSLIDAVPEILENILQFFGMIARIVCVILPVRPIYKTITSKYLTPDEVKRLTGARVNRGYYCDKKDIKEMEAEKAREP